MNVPEIIEVKDLLNEMKTQSIITDWELPYENLLTRRSAAIFFFDIDESDPAKLQEAERQLNQFDNFSYRPNTEKNLSQMKYRLTFSEEEKKKNESTLANQ